MFCTLVRHPHSLQSRFARFTVTFYHCSRPIMRFTFAVLLLNVSLALVSALPRPIYSTGIIPRETEITLERRVRTPSNPPTRKQPSRQNRLDAATQAAKKAQLDPKWQVALHQSKPGQESEHWALQFHPKVPGKGPLHVVDAVSSAGSNGVLQTDHNKKGIWNPPPPNPNNPNPSVKTHIADFPNQKAATKAIKDAKTVQLTKPFPQENCVDFTCHAVDHMVEKNHIAANAPGVQAFHAKYQAEKETVRTTTGTDANTKAAQNGGPQNQPKPGPSQPVAGPSQ